MFGPDPTAAALVLPAVPLDELYAEPARDWLTARGHEVRVNAPARVDVDGDRVTGVRVRDERIDAPIVISRGAVVRVWRRSSTDAARAGSRPSRMPPRSAACRS